ncbi:MAG TPA: heme-binding domain-containing protein [Flavobacteriaceae bacterium]|nr:heme-binding domain-containing protein [Flavobacteriaceae bacterium]
MKLLKKTFWIFLVVLVIAQFFGPEKNQGELASIDAFLTDTKPPEDVKQIFKVGCYDCHSNYTRYPWYSSITPVNYWLADHVKEGTEHLNLSKWSDYSVKKKDHKMEEIIEMVEKKEMPLASYTWTHREAKLNQDQIEAITAWAKQVRFKYSLEPKPE